MPCSLPECLYTNTTVQCYCVNCVYWYEEYENQTIIELVKESIRINEEILRRLEK